jgi:hypothetical protein
MRASKYLVESWECPLPFWYVTLSHILEGTAPDLNLLTAGRSQDRIGIIIGFSCSEVMLLDCS